jgi:acyl-CoA thioesterase-1
MNGAARRLAALLLSALTLVAPAAGAQPKRLLVIGDSLAAGYNLPEGYSFTHALDRRPHARGNNVAVLDAAVSGATTADALARLPKAFAYGADAVLVEPGGNDMPSREEPATASIAISKRSSATAGRAARG